MSKTKKFAKGGIATAAVGAMALATASPAMARDHRDRGIDVGDVIAGALIIGGIAAVASAAGKDRYRDRYRGGYRDRYYYDRRDYRRGNPRRAIEKCVRAVERDARRAGYRFADVTEIRDVDREDRGWEIEGRLVVDGTRYWGNRGYDRYRPRYDERRYDYGYYGRDRYRDRYRGRGYDRGKFECEIERGRVVDIDYSGIRGLR